MAVSMGSFASFDGVSLAWQEIGRGRPLVLLHGLFSNSDMNWRKWGTAERLAETGRRVLLLDFRAHGASGGPHDPRAYPRDVLARDVAAFVEHLGLQDYDLGGYSLGARTAIRAVLRGLRPSRLILAGMGLEGVLEASGRSDFFLRVIETRSSARPGTPEWMAAQFMKTTGVDPDAVVHVLQSQADTGRQELAAVSMPTLVVAGSEDRDNGSAAALAAELARARFQAVPGNHMSAVTKAELGEAMAAFLAEDLRAT